MDCVVVLGCVQVVVVDVACVVVTIIDVVVVCCGVPVRCFQVVVDVAVVGVLTHLPPW